MSPMQNQIDLRLDAIDRALLGLLARQDRLELVSQIETQIRAATAAGETSQNLADSVPPLDARAADASALGERRLTHKKRSALAVWAGVLGILALVMLFVMPVTYFLVIMFSEILGEMGIVSLLRAHAVIVAGGGLAAVALGISALVRLRNRGLAGHGWAITGLCTGPLPMLVGGLLAVIVGMQFGGAQPYTAVTVPPPDYSPVGRMSGPVYADDGSGPPTALPAGFGPPGNPRSAWHSEPGKLQALPENPYVPLPVEDAAGAQPSNFNEAPRVKPNVSP